jgi:glutathione S-transferase
VIDVTEPRPDWLLSKTRGTTPLPVMETADGRIVSESLVILQYLEDLFPQRAVAQRDPYRRAVENMLTRMEAEFCAQGYAFVMNQSLDSEGEHAEAVRAAERLPRGAFAGGTVSPRGVPPYWRAGRAPVRTCPSPASTRACRC